MNKRDFSKLENDPRMKKEGNIIRNFSIDKLPQLLNILNGKMNCESAHNNFQIEDLVLIVKTILYTITEY